MSGINNNNTQQLQGKTKQLLLSLPNKFLGIGAANQKVLTFKINGLWKSQVE